MTYYQEHRAERLAYARNKRGNPRRLTNPDQRSPMRLDAQGNRICPPCGARLSRAANARRYPVYCSPECDPNPYRLGKARPPRPCRAECGRTVDNKYGSYCGPCRPSKSKLRPTLAECYWCGGQFIKAGNGQRKFCSRLCCRRLHNRNHAANRRGLVVEPVVATVVFRRDGWTCHLCGLPTSREVGGPMANDPTLDHLMPVSRGGEHSYRNVGTAHRGCNSRKGARQVA